MMNGTRSISSRMTTSARINWTAFYQKYKDQFVDDYAVTDPNEDIAETWAFFVLSPKPQGDTIADQKIVVFRSISGTRPIAWTDPAKLVQGAAVMPDLAPSSYLNPIG